MIDKIHPNPSFIRDGWFDLKDKLLKTEDGYNVEFKLNRCPSIHTIVLKYTKVLGSASIYIKNKAVGTITADGEIELKGLSCGDNEFKLIGDAVFDGTLIIECVPSQCIKEASFVREGSKLSIDILTSSDGDVTIDIIGDGTYHASTDNCRINEVIDCIPNGRIEYVIHYCYDTVVGYCE